MWHISLLGFQVMSVYVSCTIYTVPGQTNCRQSVILTNHLLTEMEPGSFGILRPESQLTITNSSYPSLPAQ